jgi:hypothetical protein
MFNKDQAAKLRDLAEKQGLNQKEEPLTYSAIIGEDRQDLSREGRSLSLKGVIIAASGLALAGIIAGVFFLLQQNDAQYREIIRSMNQQGQALKSQVAVITEKTRRLESDLEQNLDKNQELASRLRNLDGTNASLNNQLSVLASERKDLLRQIEDTRKQAKELEEAKQALQEEMRKSRTQVQESASQTQEVISGLEGKIALLNAKLAQGTQGSAPLAGGQIVLINRQEDFALINKGLRNGYKKWMHLGVFHQGVLVGELVVNEARDQVSACDLVSLTGTLRLGDEVRIK